MCLRPGLALWKSWAGRKPERDPRVVSVQDKSWAEAVKYVLVLCHGHISVGFETILFLFVSKIWVILVVRVEL